MPPRSRLASDHHLVHAGDGQIRASEQEQPGTRVGQAVEQVAETGLEVGAHALAEVVEVGREERPGRAIEGSLAREDLALNLAACQPRGSKQPAELATDVVFSRPVRRRDEGGQLGLFERQFDLDRPRKEHVMELIVLEHPHVAAGPYNLGHPPQCVDWIRKAIQALGAPDQVETAGRSGRRSMLA